MPDPNALIPPPLTPAAEVDAGLAATGFAVIGPQAVETLVGAPLSALDAWLPFWDRLPADAYLLDGGKYRQRRHGAFVVDGDEVTASPPRPHWQPVDYNALHGGIERHFEQIEPGLAQPPRLAALPGRRWRRGRPRSRARSAGSSRLIRFASTPPTASAARRPRERTAMASTWSA